ncbi:Lon protease-like protein mitochondrial [Bienertia sinuspersici]
MTCDCNRLELMGIPCCHALACLEKKKMQFEHYIHEAYHVRAYAATYAPSFHPVPRHSRWETTGEYQPLPPLIRVMPGRPSQKKRMKEQGEGKQVKEKRQNKCGNCQGLGHNEKNLQKCHLF